MPGLLENIPAFGRFFSSIAQTSRRPLTGLAGKLHLAALTPSRNKAISFGLSVKFGFLFGLMTGGCWIRAHLRGGAYDLVRMSNLAVVPSASS